MYCSITRSPQLVTEFKDGAGKVSIDVETPQEVRLCFRRFGEQARTRRDQLGQNLTERFRSCSVVPRPQL
jgi:hypothetical protein